MTPPSAWVLAVDFGTTNTVAAVADSTGTRTLTIDGRPVMASAVLLVDHRVTRDSWMVGDAAVRFARRKLEWFDPSPKRSIADRTLFLGGRDVPVTEAIAALLAPIVKEAVSQHGGRPPTSFVVTHPATWAESRVQVLTDGARAATAGMRGWPAPRPMTEPEAAAQRALDIDAVPSHARLVVLDFGGGTVDVTVVDRHDDTLQVVGRPTGLGSLGGEDFDLRLARFMTAEVGAPQLFDRLAASQDPDERERAVEIRSHARDVKEQLSRQSVVPAQLPKAPPELLENTPVQISKPQLEELIRGGRGRDPGLAEAVALVVDALNATPQGPPFVGVFLVGGSSRIPLLGALVTEHTRKVPLTHGDPTTAVADGAARSAWSALVAAARSEPAAASPGKTAGGPSPPDAQTLPPKAGQGHATTQERRAAPPGESRSTTPEPVETPPRRRRRGLKILLMLLLLAGGTSAYFLNQSSTPSTPLDPLTPSESSLLEALDDCVTATQTGCSREILKASQAAWPMIDSFSGCTVEDRNYYDFDRFFTECKQDSVIYRVVWRDSGFSGSLPTVEHYENLMLTSSPKDFRTSTEVLGERIFGSWTNSANREVYACVREYEKYPVALVIVGLDNPSTHAACDDVTVLSSADMRAALR